MKIKNEFSINLVNSNLNIYKIGNKIRINTVNYKPENKYLEVEFDVPKSNMSLVRNKTDKMCLYSYGSSPFTPYYLLKGNKKVIENEDDIEKVLKDENLNIENKLGYKINDIYKFNTKFKEEDQDKSTLQFRKVESREEIEHRKRNINYKFKVMDNEQTKKMDFKKLERDLVNLKLDFKKKNIVLFDLQKIERCIKNRVVVNYSDLLKLFPNNSENIKLCLQRLTFYYKGRYILKNKFYDQNLQKIRIEILENIKNDILVNQKFNNKDIVDELCIKKGNTYYLKGYYEELVIDYKNKDLVSLLREKYIFNLQEVKEISQLEMEDVYKFVSENNLVEIVNNFYCVEFTSEIQEVIKLLEKGSFKKGEVNEIIQSQGLNMEDFFKALEKFFVLKRSTWVKK